MIKLRLARMMTVLVVGLMAFLVAAPDARAWDDFGHMEVAAVAFKKLNAKAKKRVA